MSRITIHIFPNVHTYPPLQLITPASWSISQHASRAEEIWAGQQCRILSSLPPPPLHRSDTLDRCHQDEVASKASHEAAAQNAVNSVLARKGTPQMPREFSTVKMSRGLILQYRLSVPITPALLVGIRHSPAQTSMSWIRLSRSNKASTRMPLRDHTILGPDDKYFVVLPTWMRACLGTALTHPTRRSLDRSLSPVTCLSGREGISTR